MGGEVEEGPIAPVPARALGIARGHDPVAAHAKLTQGWSQPHPDLE